MMLSPQYEKVRRLLLERRAETPASNDVEVLRNRLEAAALPAGEDVRTTAIVLGGVEAERVVAEGAENERALLYAHGGGFCLGSPATHRKLAGDVSRVTGCPCYVLDYRRGPEHPLPAAIDDVVTAYRALLERHQPQSMLMAGDSAGATLVILALARLQAAGIALPAGAIAITPWVEYRCADPSYVERAEGDPITLVPELRGYQPWFLGGRDPEDPMICALSADLRGMPPLLIHSGSGDVMCNDAVKLAARARSALVDVTHRQAPEMMHVWHVFAGRVPEATEAIEELGAFARRSLAAAARRGSETSV